LFSAGVNAIVLCLAISTNAGAVTIDVPDFKGIAKGTATIDQETGGFFNVPVEALCPACGILSLFFHIDIDEKDTRKVTITFPVPIFTTTVITISTPPIWQFVPPTPREAINFFRTTNVPIEITNITGIDLNPTGNIMLMNGFNSLAPEFIPASNETWIGMSGDTFSAPMNAITVGNLPTSLPNVDLSGIFAAADPSSTVYVSTITAPLQEFVTVTELPEPATWLLFTIGIAPLCYKLSPREAAISQIRPRSRRGFAVDRRRFYLLEHAREAEAGSYHVLPTTT
jgi:hypothetical protein